MIFGERQSLNVTVHTCLCDSVAADFLIGAACCSSVENPGMVMFQARSVEGFIEQNEYMKLSDSSVGGNWTCSSKLTSIYALWVGNPPSSLINTFLKCIHIVVSYLGEAEDPWSLMCWTCGVSQADRRRSPHSQ